MQKRVDSQSLGSVAAGAFVFLCGLMFGVVPLLRGRTFFHWDNAQQHIAQTTFLGSSLRHGTWPQWWPDVGMGVPTLAEGQSAHLYPPRVILAALFSPPTALALEVGLYLGLAALASFLFMRELRITRPAAIFGSLTYVFGGMSIVLVRNVALHRSLWILPLLLLLAERASKRVSSLLFVGTAVAFGLQVLSGHPSFAIVSAVTCSVYVVVRVAQVAWVAGMPVASAARQLGSILAVWCVALLAGIGLGAVQLVPTILHIPLSVREGGLDFEYASKGLTAGVAWMGQMVLPYAYELGDLRSAPSVFGTYFNQNPNRGFYLGAMVPLLVGIAIVRGISRERRVVTLLVTAAVVFGFALGGEAPFFPALRSLPGMEGMRYPERFLAPCSLLLAAIAAIGVDLLQRRRSRLHWFAIGYVLLAAVASVLFVASRGRLEAVGIPAVHLEAGLIGSLVLAVGAAILVTAALSTRALAKYVPWLIVIFAVADLLAYRAIGGYARTAPREQITVPSAAADFVTVQGDGSRVLSLQSADGGTFPNEVLRDLLVADLPAVWGVETADVYFSLMLGRQFTVHESLVAELNQRPDSAASYRSFLSAMNVRFVVGRPGSRLPGFQNAYHDDRVVVWENPLPMAPERLVYEAVPESIEHRPEWEARADVRLPALKSMLASWEARADDAMIIDNVRADGIDFGRTAVVDGAERLGLTGGGTGRVALLDREPDGRRYRVDTDQPALLVWSESYYPGWHATVDGEAADIYKTDYVLMGVRIPPGSHEVSFSFSTRGLRLGFAVSLVTALILALAASGRLVPPVRMPSGLAKGVAEASEAHETG